MKEGKDAAIQILRHREPRMNATLQLDSARIAALLARLDAHEGAECHVPGCIHSAASGEGRGDPGHVPLAA
jgi:hypothetical protein